MAEADASQERHEAYTCEICTEPMGASLDRVICAFPCGHVLCYPCYEQLNSTRNMVSCPFCNRRVVKRAVYNLYLG